ncbi:MAG TPA: hypothetical protein VGE54_09245 [Brevundimonas sp.]
MIDHVARSVTRNPLMRYLAVGAVCALAGGVAGGVSALAGTTGAVQVIVKAGTMAIAMAVAMLACRWWWNSIDEAAREAHKWAWWWGSTYGLAIAGTGLLTLLTTDRNATLFAGKGADEILLMGVGAVLIVQCAGYAVAWAIWWLRRL